MPIDSAGIKARARKVWPVRRVRPDVRLKTHGVRLPDQLAALPRNRSVEIVAGIDLKTGLIGEEVHDPPSARRLQPRGESNFAVAPDAVGVVVAFAVAQLRIA